MDGPNSGIASDSGSEVDSNGSEVASDSGSEAGSDGSGSEVASGSGSEVDSDGSEVDSDDEFIDHFMYGENSVLYVNLPLDTGSFYLHNININFNNPSNSPVELDVINDTNAFFNQFNLTSNQRSLLSRTGNHVMDITNYSLAPSINSVNHLNLVSNFSNLIRYITITPSQLLDYYQVIFHFSNGIQFRTLVPHFFLYPPTNSRGVVLPTSWICYGSTHPLPSTELSSYPIPNFCNYI